MKNNTSIGWRILRFPLTRITLGFLILGITATAAQLGTDAWLGHASDGAAFVAMCISAVVVYLVYIGFVCLIEQRAAAELSLASIRELIIGVIVGALLFSATIGIFWMLGFYKVTGVNGWTAMIPWLGLAIFSGVFEELLIRGILFRIMEEGLGSWLALAISALLFGFLHLANPNATLWGAIAIAIEAGILLAAAFMYTRHLWLSIGIHFAWNFTQGAVFGVAVSGNEAKGFFQSTLSGPPFLSGGAFGAEASIFAVIICLSAGIWLIWAAIKRGNIVKPFWTRRKEVSAIND
ncbi:MAG: type II CAAX endopeptidase family protein [Anaerolineales bacterium]